jgi:hypothetical protein
MPGGLCDFFSAIGRPRQQGEPVPEPFPRPDNVAQIEADTVYMKLFLEVQHGPNIGDRDDWTGAAR